MKISCMVWQIPGMPGLDLYQQIQWIKNNGFEGVSFHTTTHLMEEDPARGEGFDADCYSGEELIKLRQSIKGLIVDLHAPFENFDVTFLSPNPRIIKASIDTIESTLKLAKLIGADTVTIHTGSTGSQISKKKAYANLTHSLKQIDEMSVKYGIKIGVELTSQFEILEAIKSKNVGLTIDVGHVLKDNDTNYGGYGSIGAIIKRFKPYIYHMHIHDCDGKRDHNAMGKGIIDFNDVVGALCDIGYTGTLCLELNPTLVTTEKAVLDFSNALRKLER